MTNVTTQPKLDLIYLSDAFRRTGFSETSSSMHDIVVGLTRELGVRSTYYYGEYPADMPENKKTIDQMSDILKQIKSYSNAMGKRSVLLPFSDQNTFASPLKVAMHENGMGSFFKFRSTEYNRDLTAIFGNINSDVPNILDKGLRGVCYYNQDLIYKWDRVPA